MILKTSKGNEHKVFWAGESVSFPEKFLIQLEDKRTFAEIITDFEGLESMETSGEPGQPPKKFEGFTEILSISRLNNGNVLVTLKEPEVTPNA